MGEDAKVALSCDLDRRADSRLFDTKFSLRIGMGCGDISIASRVCQVSRGGYETRRRRKYVSFFFTSLEQTNLSIFIHIIVFFISLEQTNRSYHGVTTMHHRFKFSLPQTNLSICRAR